MIMKAPRLTEIFIFENDPWQLKSDVPWPEPRYGKKRPPVPTVQLKVNAVPLYHGTAVAEDFDVPRGPASFSTSRRLAMTYAVEESDGPRPRIMKMKITNRIQKLLSLPSVYDRKAAENAWWWMDYMFKVDISNLGYMRDKKALDDVAKLGFDGIFIAKIDSGKNEVVLFEPEKFLKLDSIEDLKQ